MSLTPHQFGNLLQKESPGSPDWRLRNGQNVCVRKFNGRYSDLLPYTFALIPGSSFTDMPVSYGVDDRSLKARRGTKGLADLEIVFTDWASLPDPIVNCRFVDLTKDIFTNPLYLPGGAKALAYADVIALQFWKNETDYIAKNAFRYYKSDADRESAGINPTDLSANATFLAKKILLGEDSFNTGYPIIEARTYQRTRPTLFQGWLRETPPGSYGVPTGYEWMRGNPARTQTRRYWEFYRTWIGADSWDHDHYPHS